MVELNKEIRELSRDLNSENKAYFDDFHIYVDKHLFLSEDESGEVMLLEIVQDLLQAQSDGISAVEYFGKNPQEIADELIKNMKPRTMKNFLKKWFYRC